MITSFCFTTPHFHFPYHANYYSFMTAGPYRDILPALMPSAAKMAYDFSHSRYYYFQLASDTPARLSSTTSKQNTRNIQILLRYRFAAFSWRPRSFTGISTSLQELIYFSPAALPAPHHHAGRPRINITWQHFRQLFFVGVVRSCAIAYHRPAACYSLKFR